MVNSLSKSKYLLLIVLVYGLIMMSWNLNYSSAAHDEALNIFMGRQMIKEQFNLQLVPLSDSRLENYIINYLIPQHTGSVMIQSVLVALGDYVGGLPGARSVSIFFGLGATIIIYFITRTAFLNKYGLTAAMLFLFTPTSLYLSRLATYDIISVFFLSLSFLLILKAEKQTSTVRIDLCLLTGAIALILASITKYLAFVYVLPFIIYVFWRNNFIRAFLFFFFPITAFLTLYVLMTIVPTWNIISGSLSGLYSEGKLGFNVLGDRIYQWIALPCILAVFGFFHKELPKKVCIPLVLLSLPVVLLHLFTGDGRSVTKNVIFPIMFLIPVAALGIDHIGSLFSMNVSNSWSKPFFITAVFIIVWVFGFTGLRWLEHQFPDIRSVAGYFSQEGFDGMRVVIDSRYGDTELVYRYPLEGRYPKAVFISLSRKNQKEQEEILEKEKPDFLVVDEFYGSKTPGDAAMEYMRHVQYSVKNFDLPLSWGMQKIRVFKKREVLLQENPQEIMVN